MGNLCQSINSKNKENTIKDQTPNIEDSEELSRNSFNFIQVIGVSRVGKSWKVNCKKYNQVFALKEISKSKVKEKKLIKNVISERAILSKLHSPFLICLEYSFQDDENLYLVSEYLPCGDLKYHYDKYKKLTEIQLKFLVVCVILGLEYLHANKVIHLDVRPENLVIDDLGYFRVINFLSSRIYSDKVIENVEETINIENPQYIAPEIIQGSLFSFIADFYSLGITCYELMLGHKPYLANSFREVKEKLIIKQYEIKQEEIPKYWTLECADFINKLIMRKPMDRLGFNGVEEIKSHPWLSNIIWKDYYDKKIKSPFGNLVLDDSYSRILYSPEKRNVRRKSSSDILAKNKNIFKDFIYYDKKSLKNFEKISKGFYDPHTKKYYKPIENIKEFYEPGETSARTSNPLNKVSITKPNSLFDPKSQRSSVNKGLPQVNLNSNEDTYENVFNKKFERNTEKRRSTGSRGAISNYSTGSNIINGTMIFNKNISINQEKKKTKL